MPVLREYRGQGFGRLLLDVAVAEAETNGQEEVMLSAQQAVIPFYQEAGFIAEGPIYMDAGIPHQDMRLSFNSDSDPSFSTHLGTPLSPKLGETSGKQRVEDRARTALDLCRQTRRQLRILSTCLEPDMYANEEFVRAISTLARKHRETFIRLLVQDDRPLRESRHPLVELAQRLSAIEIRKLQDRQSLADNERVVLADNLGLMVYQENTAISAWSSFNFKPVAEEYITRFDQLWHHARPSPWLKKFY